MAKEKNEITSSDEQIEVVNKKESNEKKYNIIQFCDMNLNEGNKLSFTNYCRTENKIQSKSEIEWKKEFELFLNRKL